MAAVLMQGRYLIYVVITKYEYYSNVTFIKNSTVFEKWMYALLLINVSYCLQLFLCFVSNRLILFRIFLILKKYTEEGQLSVEYILNDKN